MIVCSMTNLEKKDLQTEIRNEKTAFAELTNEMLQYFKEMKANVKDKDSKTQAIIQGEIKKLEDLQTNLKS